MAGFLTNLLDELSTKIIADINYRRCILNQREQYKLLFSKVND